ncbi:hypothetical protein [Actinoplanes sp. NPDC020271]|uniref:hypothetical protein n=1 Tax=Actinoplanes sp. NPDC020271 TaxID=3363896 RepID=UPI0037B816BD
MSVPDSISYREESPDGWPEAVAQSWAVDDVTNGVRLSGPCPTCGHPTQSLILHVTLAPGARPQPDTKSLDLSRPEQLLVVCECAMEHAGRPAGRSGCGRAAYLDLMTDES